MLNRAVKVLSSLRLTVVLLCAGLLLVFVGTLAQVHEGLYQAQARYFRSWFIWQPTIGNSKWPILLPGGYLLGSLLLVNLFAAHATRFKLTRKRIGIFMIHAGVILLLFGQLLTDVLARESYMRLSTDEGPRYYSESARRNELAIIDVTDPKTNTVIAIPESLLAEQHEVRDPRLPFTLHVKKYSANCSPQLLAPMAGQTRNDVQGAGKFILFKAESASVTMDDRNIPAATIEVAAGNQSLGTWDVSNWISEPNLIGLIRKQSGGALSGLLGAPQEFQYDGRAYQLAMRPIRYYHPFSIKLLNFNHAVYRGTDVPKDFRSRIRLANARTGEDREVEIYMNTPLRYQGQTYYQSGFDPNDAHVTILQVVRNPSWLTPYFSCVLVALGLLVQFFTHLIGFAAKWRTA
jgi:ResB-like family